MERRPLGREAVREYDRRAIEELGIPGLVLMENAGRAVADVLNDWPEPFVVCCGKGNNGGDGFVVARHLASRGGDVRVVLFAAPGDLSGDAATNHGILRRCGVPIRTLGDDFPLEGIAAELAGAGTFVDALLGTGTRGTVREPYAAVISALNGVVADSRTGSQAIRVLAIDLPSGMDCDTGEPLGPVVRAETTCTLVAPKPGFSNPRALAMLGRLVVIDLGVPGPRPGE